MASGDEETANDSDDTSGDTRAPETFSTLRDFGPTPRLGPDPGPLSEAPSRDPPGPPPSSGSFSSWETVDVNGNLRPGQIVFGRYYVERLLGRGGMGSVWLVRHLELDRQRALKLIVAGLATDVEARGRFQREAKILARISEHPHAVAVHDARLTGTDVAYIDMAYVEGQSLDKIFLKGRPMPLDWVDRILGQLCAVLQFAHDNQIIHRDLKPSNLMLLDGRPEGEEHLKVLDFGIGKIVGGREIEGDPRTMAGNFIGTPPYTSPEQATGEAEPRSDFYSVGVILYEFLTGYRPFVGNIVGILTDTMITAPPPFKQANPDADVPPEVERVVMRCLAKKPEDRPKSARELADEFHRAVVQSGYVTPGDERRAKKSWPMISGAVAAGLLLIAAAFWFARPVADKGNGRGGAPDKGNGTFASDGRGPKPKGSGTMPELELNHTAPTTPGPASVVVVFDPKTAEVTVGGKPRSLDERGRLKLETSELPAEVVARAEGREPIVRTISRGDYKAPILMGLAATPTVPEAELPGRAEAILKGACRRCHGVDFVGEPFDVLDRDALVASGASPLVVPGNPSRSRLYIEASHPHPAAAPAQAPPSADLEILRRWIESGANPAKSEPRPLRTDEADLAAVVVDLRAASEADRPFLRYVTLSSLSNRPLPERTLRQARAAVSKALNGLIWGADIVIPRAVDGDGLVLAIDVRGLGWEKTRAWDRLLLPQYPYGLTHRSSGRESLRRLAREVQSLSPVDLPVIRGDWLVATATRPPLYHGLLGLPRKVADLEAKLEVNAKADFQAADLVRAASAKNPHALHPRIIDLHMPVMRAFWRTYELRTEEGAGGILVAPLGPSFDGHPFPEVAFRPDSESILFALPNGLNAYFLANGEGDRVESAPEDLLRDPLRTAGSPAVVNGLSCIACHRAGVKRFRDELGLKVVAPEAQAAAKLAQLMPKPGELEEVLVGHEKRFLAALDKAAGPFLKVAEDANVEIGEFPEPIGPIAQLYQADLSANDVAAELGLANAAEMATKLSDLDRDGTLGLAPLLRGGKIPRQRWVNAFVGAVQALKLGTEKKVYGGKPD